MLPPKDVTFKFKSELKQAPICLRLWVGRRSWTHLETHLCCMWCQPGVMLSRGSAGLLDKGFRSTQCPVLQSVFPQGKGFRQLQVTHYWVAENSEPGTNNHFIYLLIAASPHLRWTQGDESLLISSCVLCVTYNDQGWASRDSRWYWVIGWDFCP